MNKDKFELLDVFDITCIEAEEVVESVRYDGGWSYEVNGEERYAISRTLIPSLVYKVKDLKDKLQRAHEDLDKYRGQLSAYRPKPDDRTIQDFLWGSEEA